jgi:hypothetical protein
MKKNTKDINKISFSFLFKTNAALSANKLYRKNQFLNKTFSFFSSGKYAGKLIFNLDFTLLMFRRSLYILKKIIQKGGKLFVIFGNKKDTDVLKIITSSCIEKNVPFH